MHVGGEFGLVDNGIRNPLKLIITVLYYWGSNWMAHALKSQVLFKKRITGASTEKNFCPFFAIRIDEPNKGLEAIWQ